MVGLNFPIPTYGLDTGDFLKTVNNIVLFSETWKARLDAMNKEQEALTEQRSKPSSKEGKPRSRLSPPGNSSASRAFQKCPNAGISGAPQYGVHSAENDIDAGKP